MCRGSLRAGGIAIASRLRLRGWTAIASGDCEPRLAIVSFHAACTLEQPQVLRKVWSWDEDKDTRARGIKIACSAWKEGMVESLADQFAFAGCCNTLRVIWFF